MNLQHNWRAAAATAVLAMTTAGGAWANSIAAVADSNTFTIFTAGEHFLSGMQTATFFHPQGQRLVATFSSECAVRGPFNNHNANTDVDIVVVHAVTGAIVQTLAPTQGNADAFCSSKGRFVFDAFATHSVTAFTSNLGPGTYKVRVRARLNNGALGAWFGPRSLVVWR